MSATYGNLIDVKFDNFSQLNDEMLIEFHAKNPQLQIFSILGYKSLVTSSILQGIGTRLSNLVNLEFFNRHVERHEKRLDEDLMHLSELQHLRRYIGAMPSSSVLDAFADNDIPIEELYVGGLNRHIVKSLSRLTKIQRLTLSNFSYEMLVDLVPKLSNLEYLTAF